MQVENDELKRENKDLKSQIKKLKKVKTGQGDEALEVCSSVPRGGCLGALALPYFHLLFIKWSNWTMLLISRNEIRHLFVIKRLQNFRFWGSSTPL